MFIELTNTWLLVGALVALVGLVLGAWSSRRGVPFLLVFLVVGMLAGEDGPAGIEFDNLQLSFIVGNLALAVILLDGGLRTHVASFRAAFRPALMLATVGVALTAVLLALAARWLFDLPWLLALLMGAVVASTDAAAVFALLKSGGVRLNERAATTLEVESGINDPMAVFMTVTLIGLITGSMQPSALPLALMFVQQIGLGLVFGAVFGVALAWLLRVVQVNQGLMALLITAGGVVIFGACNLAGGSGFLAVYLAGVIVGNRRVPPSAPVLQAMDGLAWLAQAGMFLLLGMLATPSALVPILLPALALAGALMFVARPLACALCLLPFRFRPQETAFISWVGLRGAVPIVLALFPLLGSVPQASLIFNVVLVVVLASLVVQGMSIAPAARWLEVALHPRPEPALRTPLDPSGQRELVMFALTAEHPWVGARADSLQLTPDTDLFAIGRAGHALSTSAAATLQVDDALWFTSPPEQVDRLCDLFGAGADHAPQTLHFVFDAAASLADVLALYAPGATAAPEDSLADAICRVHRVPVEGDSVRLGRIRLTVVAMEGATIRRVAATIEPIGSPTSDADGA